MAWIKSEQALASHPKLHMLAEDLGVSVPQTVGHLHLLWWWALDYCQDGYLTKYKGFIPIAAQWEGDKDKFVNSLIKHNWIDEIDNELVIHDWLDYTGQLILVREKDAERKRKARTSKNSKNSANRDDWETSDTPNKSIKKVQKMSDGRPADILPPSDVRGEEKRGDETRVDEIVVSNETVEKTSNKTVFTALCKTFNYNPTDLTSSSRGMLNKVAKELAEVGATAWDIEERARNYAITYGKKPTPMALTKHWTDMAVPNPQIDNKTLSKLQSQMTSKNNLEQWVETEN